MPPKKGSKQAKDPKSTPKTSTIVVETVPEIVLTDVRTITITVEAYENFVPTFTASELDLEASYSSILLGQTEKTPVTGEELLTVNCSFTFQCDVLSTSDVDKLISNPVLFTITEYPATVDFNLLNELAKGSEKPTYDLKKLSVRSATEISKSFEGKPETTTTATQKDSAGSSKKGSGTPKKKDSKSGKKSPKKEGSKTGFKGSKSSIKTDTSATGSLTSIESVGPRVAGCCVLDLLPLFLGNRAFKESLPMRQALKYLDDRLVPTPRLPKLLVSVETENVLFPENVNFNIIYLTLESMYNVPEIMNSSMTYQACTVLPDISGKFKPFVIPNGIRKEKRDLYKFKKWPEVMDDSIMAGVSLYRIDDTIDTMKNKTDIDLNVIETDSPRIEWNILKRIYLQDEGVKSFHSRLTEFRKIPLEFFVATGKSDETLASVSQLLSTDSKRSKDTKQSVKSSKSTTDKGKKKGSGKGSIQEEYLHLMTFIDVSSLLYPGVEKCRVVCPLSSYQEKEILTATGLQDSFFLPKPPPSPPSTESKGKKGKGKDKSSGKSSKSSKVSKASKSAPQDSRINVTEKLPPPPEPELPPSIPVYNEGKRRCFVAVEVSLLKPLAPKRKLEDLTDQLHKLIPERPPIPKIVASSRLAQVHFEKTIKKLSEDMFQQHKVYLEEMVRCKCELKDGKDQIDFLVYLQRTGAYQNHLATITEAISFVVKEKFNYQGEINRTSKDYEDFISEVYSYLVDQMNSALNEIAYTANEIATVDLKSTPDSLLFYAKEAAELGAYELAERYYVERIIGDERNASYWFDYGVFSQRCDNQDKAMECAKEAISLDSKHFYSLAFYGVLLAEDGNGGEAETCLVSAVTFHSTWVEGWGILFLYYKDRANYEGCDHCEEMALKSLRNFRSKDEYLWESEDLAWFKDVASDTVFMRTAILLMKMFLFSYAEKALAMEKLKRPGICHYYSAAILYYKEEYVHALGHLEEAVELQGCGYAVGSLLGHVHMALDHPLEAKKYYDHVLQSFNRPEHIHMVNVNLALIHDKTFDDNQTSRKLLLRCCKYSPTPYTWLSAGLLFMKQNDHLSAEECLIQSNVCDNRFPETWAYLALVNVELEKYVETEHCYEQAIKNGLNNEDLMKRMCDALRIVQEKLHT